jgi:hypothetical protein
MNTALASIVPVADDYIKNQTTSSTFYDLFGWFGELTDLEPLDAYMLKTSHAAILTYTNGEPLKTAVTHKGVVDGFQKSLKTGREEAFLSVKQESYEYSGQVTASVYLNGENFAGEDYCLYSVVGGQIRGVSRGMWFEPGKEWIHNHLTYSNFTEGDTVRFRLQVEGDGIQAGSGTWYNFEEFVVFTADMVVSNALNPFILKTSSLLAPSAMNAEPTLEVYPNPAGSLATIRYSIVTDQSVTIQVIDFSGRVVQQLELGRQQSGEHLTGWNTGNLEQGVYYLRLKDTQGVYQQVVITR